MATSKDLPRELERLADERKDPVLLSASMEIDRLRSQLSEGKALLRDAQNIGMNSGLWDRIDAWLNGAGE